MKNYLKITISSLLVFGVIILGSGFFSKMKAAQACPAYTTPIQTDHLYESDTDPSLMVYSRIPQIEIVQWLLNKENLEENLNHQEFQTSADIADYLNSNGILSNTAIGWEGFLDALKNNFIHGNPIKPVLVRLPNTLLDSKEDQVETSWMVITALGANQKNQPVTLRISSPLFWNENNRTITTVIKDLSSIKCILTNTQTLDDLEVIY